MDTQPNPSPEQQPQGALPDQLQGAGLPEQMPQPQGAGSGAPQNSGQPITPAPLSRDDVAQAIAGMPTASNSSVAPAAASDQDVVEPEWVDAAEQAIAQTAGNPYAEEEAVEALQIDYLKKRYGHEVKKPEES